MEKREVKVHFPNITVKEIYEENEEKWKLKLLAGKKGLNTKIDVSDLNRPGLLFAGFEKIFLSERAQIIGETEILFLNSLGKNEMENSIRRLFKYEIPCIFVTKKLVPPEFFLKLSEEKNVPVIQTPTPTTEFMRELNSYLSFKLAPWTIFHGTMVDVYGVGMFLTGRSGIGKSECAIDLVTRGHRLIADDVVKITRHPNGFLIGSPMRDNSNFTQFVEIRGIGIVDILSMYGIMVLRESKKIDIKVQLVDWSESLDYERTGLIEKKEKILEIEIPYVQIPLNPGKNITVLVEIAALNYLLKKEEYNPAKLFSEMVKKKIVFPRKKRNSIEKEIE